MPWMPIYTRKPAWHKGSCIAVAGSMHDLAVHGMCPDSLAVYIYTHTYIYICIEISIEMVQELSWVSEPYMYPFIDVYIICLFVLLFFIYVSSCTYMFFALSINGVVTVPALFLMIACAHCNV